MPPIAPRAAWVVLATLLLWLAASEAFAEEPSTDPAIPPDMPDVGVGAIEDHPIPSVPADFLHHEANWIRFEYPREARGRVEPLVESAAQVREALRAELGRPVLERLVVRVARDQDELTALAPVGLPPPEYAEGVAYARYRLVILLLEPPHGGEPANLAEVFRHELAHVALFDAVGGRHVPRWFNEGYAVHASGESSLARARTLWSASLSNRILPLSDLDRTFPAGSDRAAVAYAQSADFVRYLLRKQDRPRFRKLIDAVETGATFDRAAERAYGVPLRNLEREWLDELDGRYSYVPVFLGGGLLWVLAFVVVGVGWARRRRRHRVTLQRWAQEEAEEDRRKEAQREQPVRVTLTSRTTIDSAEIEAIRTARMADIPKVEHEGEWHTLH
jgi:hypothetical protein